jgi:hypothetical protein
MTAGLTPDQVTALAATHYGDPDIYDSDGERLFALLVDVADAYVLDIRARQLAEYERATAQDRPPVSSLGTMAGLGAIEIAVRGLAENLEMRDEARQ